MTSTTLHSTGESWKELANRSQATKAGVTVQRMVAGLNEIFPFANASGIFDNGCGTGTIISYILDTYGSEVPSSASILAGDFSEHMLQSLSKTKESKSANAGGVWDRLELRNIDAHNLSTIPTASISHITGGHLYFLLQDARKALEETLRVLSPGGVLAISSGKGSQHLDALTDAFAKVKPDGHLKLIREPWNSEAGVKELLEAVGFVDVSTSSIESQVEYKEHRDFTEMLLVMPVMKTAMEEFDEDQKTRMREQVIENLRLINPAEPGSLKGTSILAFARKAASPS